MNILHILEDFSIHSGGIRTVVKELDKRLNNMDYKSYIISSGKEEEDAIYMVKCKQIPLLYSKEWKIKINNIHVEKSIDVFHIHGTWRFPQYIAAKYAIKNKIPYILTPHGMYEPWIWKKGLIKKKIYFNFLSKKVFSKANIIHAITGDEKQNLRKIFRQSNFVEIPNLIDYTAYKIKSDNITFEKYILYVGRLDQKKGIDILIKSFARINPKNVKLKIAGPFNDYKVYLEGLIKKLQIEDKVEFLGLIKGENKTKLFVNAFVFVAPSYSEVVGMVNLEAAVLKTPVITTYQTGLDRMWNEEGGLLINPTEEELFEALRKVLEWSDETRNTNGEKLYNFILKKYSWDKGIKDWDVLYRSLTQNNE